MSVSSPRCCSFGRCSANDQLTTFSGSVGYGIYKQYFAAGRGSVLVPLLALMICLSQVATVLCSYALIWWQGASQILFPLPRRSTDVVVASYFSEDHFKKSNGMYMGECADRASSASISDHSLRCF